MWRNVAFYCRNMDSKVLCVVLLVKGVIPQKILKAIASMILVISRFKLFKLDVNYKE